VVLFSEDCLPDRVLRWVLEAADPHARIVSTSRLHGGASSAVYSVKLRMKQVEKEFVLRQFDNVQWLKDEPDLAVHEAESLRWAEKTGLQTPEIIAFDENGSKCGVPTVLMTKLEGSVNLQPKNMEQWLNEMAEALVRIHSVSADDFPWAYFTYIDIESLEKPLWTSVPDLWDKAIHICKGPRPISKQCFIHRDYHPTNVLWKENRLSGVVDWVNSCRGPAGIDIGHCRWNLAMLYDVKTADTFLDAYTSHAGRTFSHDPYWDILSLMDTTQSPPEVYMGWTANGVTGLTEQMMLERYDAYLTSLLKRT
jgi:aminoglycoside phosphotransferase (APT) family kinase protein